jgi:hypothetical protein
VDSDRTNGAAVLSAESAFDPGLLRRVAGDCEAGGLNGAARLLHDIAWHVEHGDTCSAREPVDPGASQSSGNGRVRTTRLEAAPVDSSRGLDEERQDGR